MQIEKQFTVAAPAEQVWAFLTDPNRVAQCLPGAALTNQIDEKTYEGTITVKVGPVASSYRGKATFERLDAATRTAEVVAAGQDVRGKGGADLKMTSKVVERGPRETQVTVMQDINVTGILAQMGRGMIQDVGDQLFEKFLGAMRAQLESQGEAVVPPSAGSPAQPPIQVVSLGVGVLVRAAGRAARHPLAWLAVIVIVVLLWWALRGS
ncbi:MAG: SRPBCC family protein [Gemmatimonadetes bacterium]|nr:SRPBCC family protein [Gemmatimonadota bacterium]